MKIKMQTWLSYLVIILPIGYGWLNYHALPAVMATHFSGGNAHPDGYMGKPGMVFGMPLLMVAIQFFCLAVTRLNRNYKGTAPRFERLVTWIIPLVTVVAYTATISYNLGHAVDIRRIAIGLVAVIFIAMGNYVPTISADQYHQMHRGVQWSENAWRRLKYWYAYWMVGGGLLLLASLLAGAVVSTVVLVMIVVGLLLITVYGLVRRVS